MSKRLKFVDNPPWVDSLLEDNWDELASVVQPDMLPFAVVQPAPGRRRARVTVAPGAELGCGHYGCVMATRTPGVVCKVTSDRSEAEFVEAAWRVFGRDYADGWPRGIVRYHKIIGLSGEHASAHSATVAHSGPTERAVPSGPSPAPLWMLWRDEVDHIGSPPGNAGAELGVFRFYAQQVYETLREPDEDLAEAVSLWRRGAVTGEADHITSHSFRGLSLLRLPSVRRLAVCLEMASRAIDALDDLPSIRDALRACLDHGMLLADVHKDNVGRGKRGWVITDPGHYVSLSPRRAARGTLEE